MSTLGLVVAVACILLPGVLMIAALLLIARRHRRRPDASAEGQTPGSQLDAPPPAPPWPLA